MSIFFLGYFKLIQLSEKFDNRSHVIDLSEVFSYLFSVEYFPALYNKKLSLSRRPFSLIVGHGIC